ncbi:ribose 5-phosphate isomerase B [Chloroflexota bacterium]
MEGKPARIAIGCDHRGLGLKQTVIKYITESENNYDDYGCYATKAVDYPDIAKKVTKAVVSGNSTYGILICDTGIGMSIAANKVKGVRTALCHDTFSAQRARQHNDANIICLGVKMIDEPIPEVITAFLNTTFDGGRHVNRLNKLKDMSNVV